MAAVVLVTHQSVVATGTLLPVNAWSDQQTTSP